MLNQAKTWSYLLVEIVIHPGNILLIYNGHCTFNQTLGLADFSRSVVLCNVASGRHCSPVSKYSMPDCYMLDVGMLLTNGCSGMLQPTRKPLLIGFEVCPATLELRLAMIVHALPIVVDDEVGNYQCYRRRNRGL